MDGKEGGGGGGRGRISIHKTIEKSDYYAMIGSRKVIGIGKASIFLGRSINGKVIVGLLAGSSINEKEMETQKFSNIVAKVILNSHEHVFIKHPLKSFIRDTLFFLSS